MALRIPQSQGPGISPDIAPTVRVRPTMDAANFGGGQAAANAFGQARGLAGEVAEIAFREEMKAQEAQLNELDTELGKLELDSKAALYKVQGKGALEAQAKMYQDFDKAAQDVMKRATASRVRERLGSSLERRRMALQAASEPYVAGELRKYKAEVASGRVAIERENAFQSFGDPVRVDMAVDQIRRTIINQEAAEGTAPELIQARVFKETSSVYAGVIEQHINAGNDLEAKRLYDTAVAGKMLTKADADSLLSAVKRGNYLGEAQRVTDSLIAKAKTLQDARRMMKEMNLDPEVRQRVDSLLDREYGLQEEAARQVKTARFARAAMDIKNLYGKGKSAAEKAGKPFTPELLVGPIEWDKMDVEEQGKLEAFFSDIQEAEGVKTRNQLFAKLHGMSREQLAAYSDDDFRAEFLVGLSNADYNHAEALRAEAKKGGEKYNSLKAPADLIFDGVRRAGLGGAVPADTLKSISDTDSKGKRTDPAGESKENAYKALYDRVEARRQAYWADNKKNPDDEKLKTFVAEEASALRALRSTKVTVTRSRSIPWGGLFEDVEVPVGELKPGDRIPYDRINPAVRSGIEQLLNQVGKPRDAVLGHFDFRVERIAALMEMGRHGVLDQVTTDSMIEDILDEKR